MDVYCYWSCSLSDRIITGRLENTDQLCQAPIIRVARRTISVGLDPFRMLRQEIAMQLLLQVTVRPNLMPVSPQLRCTLLCRPCVHSRTFDFDGRAHYNALERFVTAPSVGLRTLSFG
jgi:hypothetical protein